MWFGRELNPGLHITSRMPQPLGHPTTLATWLYIYVIVAGSSETNQHIFCKSGSPHYPRVTNFKLYITKLQCTSRAVFETLNLNCRCKHNKTLLTIYSATRLTVATQQTFLQVSQSRYANLIDRHASIKSFNTQLPNENLSILTNKVEAKAQQLYKT